MNKTAGERFPNVELLDQEGQLITLSQIAGKFPLILAFYRGYW